MVTVLKEGDLDEVKKEYPMWRKCYNCGCEFTFDLTDIISDQEMGSFGGPVRSRINQLRNPWMRCPCCNRLDNKSKEDYFTQDGGNAR